MPDRLWLKPMTLEHCTQRYVDWLNDPLLMRYLETRYEPVTMASNRAYVSACLANPDVRLWAITLKETGEHIGNIKLGPINHRHVSADLGYFIGEKHLWGRGYATEAISMATNYAFTAMNLRLVRAGVYKANAASGAALCKAGYEDAGVIFGELLLDGKPHDHLFYSKTNPEWKPS